MSNRAKDVTSQTASNNKESLEVNFHQLSEYCVSVMFPRRSQSCSYDWWQIQNALSHLKNWQSSLVFQYQNYIESEQKEACTPTSLTLQGKISQEDEELNKSVAKLLQKKYSEENEKHKPLLVDLLKAQGLA